MKSTFRLFEILFPLIVILILWELSNDISVMLSGGYLATLITALLLKVPNNSWIAQDSPQRAVKENREKKISFSHICNGQRGELENFEIEVEQIAHQTAISDYQEARFLDKQSTQLLTKMEDTILWFVFTSLLFFAVTIFIQAHLKKKESEEEIDYIVKFILAWIPPAIQLTRLVSLCLQQRERNKSLVIGKL